MTNLQDIPKLAPYFFVDPDLVAPEAYGMYSSVTPEEYCERRLLLHVQRGD